MRKLFVPMVAVLFVPVALAKVWTTVYQWDGTTPLAAVDPNYPTKYRDIMAGTRLVFVISSDQGQYWCGGLLLSRADEKYGTLSGRGCAPNPGGLPECQDSCLPAAGWGATVSPTGDSWRVGLEFNTNVTYKDARKATAGDWFIVDYQAQQAGTCAVGFYDYFVDYNAPKETLAFTHVPSRDFNGDRIVNFKDFALLASRWGPPIDPNCPDAAVDLNADRRIDTGDLALFTAYWLERTDSPKPAADPNKPATL